MKRNLRVDLTNKVIRYTVRVSEKTVMRQLEKKENKDRYKLPKLIKFPSKVEQKKYGDMQVFEMQPQEGRNKKVLFIHGGGYLQNFSYFHWRFLNKLCKATGAGFAVPNYPLLPKYTYKESYAKVIEYYKEFSKNNDMNDVILAGDSAGGGFCLSLLLQLKELNLPLPSKTILISPFVDVTGANENMGDLDAMIEYNATIILGKAWAGGDKLKNWKISPLYGDLKDLPPTYIFVGTSEVLHDECIRLYNKLKTCGNKVRLHIGRNLGHDYPLLPIPESNQAINNMIKFINE